MYVRDNIKTYIGKSATRATKPEQQLKSPTQVEGDSREKTSKQGDEVQSTANVATNEVILSAINFEGGLF